ncbi:transketolase [Acidomonas methanolica]|uniref:Transketolase n=1 Tax=Acidomonas methanolica NBRC 104435 TaxID=1231351 RepID=A0A023D531_ACIMT|nr:transketolase [Acidomonas methanolica]TCS24438.1 transketolase [Acidomonas methanolica]GAJ29263.1 transketolase [Acidomonas methanolica NBRC 104435]GBQ50192.1 transketolase [Acidomonas methanolica]GEK99890.1 transketolase [Acidomonas methanolica NBRC 104435]
MNVILNPMVTEEVMMANAIRALTMDAVQKANSGHPGMPMGMADVAAVLFSRFITVDPTQHDWPDRDRLVLSAGHGSMLLYALNHLIGYPDMDMAEIRRFRQWGARTAGHPEYGHAQGIEVTTGPLGQGIATAVGMALAERMMAARFPDLTNHYTYVIAGDGCLMEGVGQEAIDLAGHLRLGKLIVLWDDNGITIDGDTKLSTTTDQIARFRASGWNTAVCDGHKPVEISRAIFDARASKRPTLIACRTVIGFGAPAKQGTHEVHGALLGVEEVRSARAHLGWDSAPFEVPDAVYAAFGRPARRGRDARAMWEKRFAASPNREAFVAMMKADSAPVRRPMAAFKAKLIEKSPSVATRKASEMALEVVNGVLPFTIGGSADLTGSNLTRTTGMESIAANSFAGRYIHYGIREHGMAAAMNGLALHGGFRPYGGTFLAFADYCRPAIRLAALMGIPTIFVMTHDSIGLGEDGPTHQPVETLASLRAIPNLVVLRPCDAVETAEAWEIALETRDRPVLMALSRQSLPTLRSEARTNLTASGGYVLRAAERRDVTLIATGSEVEIAWEAADRLAKAGIDAAIVSLPSFELFAAQPKAYRDEVLGEAPRIGVEAAIRMGWGEVLRPDDAFIGMTGFGASAPAPELYRQFGITADAVAETAHRLTGK